MVAPQHKIETTKGSDIRFRGEQVAFVTSFDETRDMWSELTLWRTPSDRFVIRRVRMALDDAANPFAESIEAHACGTSAELIAWLGGANSWLVKDLLDEAGIDHAEVIE